MNTDGGNRAEECPHREVTERVLAGAFQVSNALGCGFLEKVYENAMVVELRKANLSCAQQVPLRVLYDDVTVGEYVADLIVEGAVLVEVKATEEDHPVFTAQILNYLRATRLPVGLLLNFGRPRLSYHRYMMTSDGTRHWIRARDGSS